VPVDTESVSDAEFLRLLTTVHPFSSFLEADLLQEGWILSTRPLERAQMNVAFGKRVPIVSCVVRFTPDKRQIRGVEMRRWNERSKTYELEPIDFRASGDWSAAKIHTLSGLYFLIQFARHPVMHFSQEVLLAALDRVWPDPNHVVRLLMAPHVRFTKETNTVVLKGNYSVLQGDDSCCCWDAMPMSRTDAQSLFYIAGESTLSPTATISLPTGTSPHMYGLPRSLDSYGLPTYRAIQAFTQEIVESRITPTEEQLFVTVMRQRLDTRTWPVTIRAHQLLADFIFKGSFQHAWEHEMVARVPLRSHPFRLGFSPAFPDPNEADEAQASDWDLAKYACYRACFERWTRSVWFDTLLVNVQYGFPQQELQDRAHRFRTELRKCIPEDMVDRMPTSIEF
jgi:hypothetical protein